MVFEVALVLGVMTDTSMIDEDWLQQLDGLRPLAQRLVRDESRADDAVQRTLLKAMTSKGRPKGKGFWARVVRNEAIDEHRAESARQHHELEARRDFTAPSAHAVVSEAESQSMVSDAVLALDEPYRTVILLRFFKGLKIRVIASELDRPMGTVQSQLDRGLELLRGRLRREFGDGQRLALGLLPLATGKASLFGAKAASLSLLLTPLAMKLTWILPLVAIGWLGVRFTGGEGIVPQPVVAGATIAADPADPSLGLDDGDADAQAALPAAPKGRVALGQETKDGPSAAVRTEPDTAKSFVLGRALRISGDPFSHAELERSRGGARTQIETTDELGEFEYAAGESIRPRGDRWALVASQESPTVGEFVFAPTVHFAGQIVDEAGFPLSRVSLFDSRHLIEAGLGDDPRWKSKSSHVFILDAEGRFDLQHVATWPGRTVTLAHPIFGEMRVPVPSSDQLDARVVFPGATSGYELTVRLEDGNGRPVTGAGVTLGFAVFDVGPSGQVSMSVDQTTEGSEVMVVRTGFAPQKVQAPTIAEARSRPELRTVSVRHWQKTDFIEGVVVDADGTAVAGAKVGVYDGPTVGRGQGLETMYFEDGLVLHGAILTDDKGQFRVPHSGSETVTLRAAARAPLRMGEVTSNGEPVHIVLPAPITRCEVTGTVVDFNGEPLEGADVSIIAHLRPPCENIRPHPESSVRTASTKTNAEGGFDLPHAGGAELQVVVRSGSTRAYQRIVPGGPSLTVVLDLLCNLEVALGPAPAGAVLTVLDGDGMALKSQRHHGASIRKPFDRHRLPGGDATHLLVVPQSSRQVQITLDGKVIRSAMVRPDPSHTTAVIL